MRPRSPMVVAAPAALALALLLMGCATTAGGDAAPGSTPTQPASDASIASPFDAGGLQDPGSAAGDQDPMAVSHGTPTRVRIPSIGVDSSLEDLGIDAEGRLAAPQNYDLVGWYADGVAPGEVGPSIIAGHVDSPTAPAVFARLGELAEGAEIAVDMSDGTALTFVVSGSAQSAKAEFPTAEVYSNVPAPELRLITCAGSFDSSIGHYTDNLIIFATLA